MSEFEIYYLGEFSEADKAVLAKHQKDIDAVNARGDNFSVEDLVGGRMKGAPGLGRRVITVKGYEMEFEAKNYAPDNPIYNDREYAKKARYGDIIAFPSFAMAAEFWSPMPECLRDYLVVSGLNHEWKLHRPAYEGDTLYSIATRQDFIELTIPGTEYRTFGISGSGKVFNQKGELVAEAFDRTKESLRRFSDPAKRGTAKPYFWECPRWWDRPRHYYTDEDWSFIKDVWLKETARGKEPLYWEDVNVGDEPSRTANGPITTLDQVKYHGLGEIGSPELKKRLQSPMAERMQRDERDGIYYLSMGVGHLDEGRDPNKRAAFYNFMPTNHVITMLENWMGECGTLKGISWRIMNELPGYEGKIPEWPEPNSYIGKVPYLKDKKINIHGLVGDLCLNKSYVAGKYEKDGEYIVELVWWCETIDGLIYQEGEAAVALPARNNYSI